MATIHLRVPEETLAQLTPRAEAKTVAELAAEALKNGLAEQSWQDLLRYGLETGASGYREDNVPDLVRRRRKLWSQTL